MRCSDIVGTYMKCGKRVAKGREKNKRPKGSVFLPVCSFVASFLPSTYTLKESVESLPFSLLAFF